MPCTDLYDTLSYGVVITSINVISFTLFLFGTTSLGSTAWDTITSKYFQAS